MREQLIKLRKSRNLTQDDMAKNLNISRSFYGHIESGTRNPGLKLAQKIANFFDTTVDVIFFESKSFEMKQSGYKKNKAV